MSVREFISRQREEILVVLAALAALVAATPVLVQAGSVGWRNGVLFAIADSIEGVLPGNVDVPVVLLAGVVVGWLVLFALDATKRVQTAAMVPAGAIVVIMLGDLDHVLDAIGREPLPFVLATVVSIVVTAVVSKRFRGGSGLRRHGITGARLLQFPTAARGLFVVLTAVILIVAIQYPFMSRSEADPSPLIVAPSALIAIVALGTFVQYTARRDVVTIAPDGTGGIAAEAYTLTGLYELAKARFYGTPLDRTSDRSLERAIANPHGAIETGFDDPVRFAYLSKRLRRLIVEVNTADYRFSSLTAQRLARLSQTGLLDRGRFRMSRAAERLTPTALVRSVTSGDNVTRMVGTADLILLVVQYPEDENTADVERAFELLTELGENSVVDAKLIVTHADRAEVDYEEFDSDDHRRMVLNRLEQLVPAADGHEPTPVEEVRRDLLQFQKVYLLEWDLPHGERQEGFERVLRDIGG